MWIPLWGCLLFCRPFYEWSLDIMRKKRILVSCITWKEKRRLANCKCPYYSPSPYDTQTHVLRGNCKCPEKHYLIQITHKYPLQGIKSFTSAEEKHTMRLILFFMLPFITCGLDKLSTTLLKVITTYNILQPKFLYAIFAGFLFNSWTILSH